jgi:hypothetical protein
VRDTDGLTFEQLRDRAANLWIEIERIANKPVDPPHRLDADGYLADVPPAPVVASAPTPAPIEPTCPHCGRPLERCAEMRAMYPESCPHHPDVVEQRRAYNFQVMLKTMKKGSL